MKIVQLLPTLSYGDGVGNDTLAIDKIIKELGYDTMIYAENIDPRVDKRLVKNIDKMSKLHTEDIIIYHLSTGTVLNEKLRDYPCRKLVVYHNVTPAHYFEEYSRVSAELCENGRKGIRLLRDVADYCWADSEYNKQELRENGYKCDIDVVPIVVPFDDYKKEPDSAIIQKYQDDWTNIVFVGRIAPNKKQEDVIKTFYYYKKYINAKSRLFLVGSYGGMERYHLRLQSYISELDLKDVYMTGHIKFNEILAYYKVADVFLCMSEHEGFCIPLLEAMYFDVPIVAYSYTGVKETLGYAGLQLNKKDCKCAAEMINLLVTNAELRNKVVDIQRTRLCDFSYDLTKSKIVNNLKGFIE